MKIRIQGNTVRVRLQQAEMDQLKGSGLVLDSTQFPGSEFQYSVALSKKVYEPEAIFEGGHIRVLIPEKSGEEWINSNQVGIENAAYTEQGPGLKILLEKDFQCLHERRNEDETDAFPNPLAR